VEVDERTESIGKKIRETEVRKVPYMLVVGDREAEAGEVSVRRHREGDQGSVAVAEFAGRVSAEVAERA
jgi:threonyl-tRNA synthetase